MGCIVMIYQKTNHRFSSGWGRGQQKALLFHSFLHGLNIFVWHVSKHIAEPRLDRVFWPHSMLNGFRDT